LTLRRPGGHSKFLRNSRIGRLIDSMTFTTPALRATPPLIPTLLIGLFTWATSASASEFYVAPRGTADGDGSIARPWDLATGLGQPARVHPGDTIWLRGGRYAFPAGGNILIGLTGTAAAPITVAQFPGERATLDIRGAAQGLFFTNVPAASGAAYVNFRDFEITDSDPDRSKRRPVAVYVRTSDHLKFINLVVHDTGIGFDLNTEATNTEVYGSLVYYCDDAGDAHGYAHGIYIQNVAGYKKAIDNIVFSNSGYGIHAFPHTEDGVLLDVSLIGNVAFNAGSLGSYPPAPDLLLGGDAVAIKPVVRDNLTYKTAPGTLWNQQIGYGAGCRSPTVVNNYFVGTTVWTACTSGLNLSGNTFYGPTLSQPQYGAATTPLPSVTFPTNTFSTVRPSGTRVFVRPNQYESGRANIAIYNWDQGSDLNLDLSAVLNLGDRYELRNVENFFGSPTRTGVFDGQPVRIPWGVEVAAVPVGVGGVSDPVIGFRSFVLQVTHPSSSCPPVFGLALNPGHPFCALLTARDPGTGAAVRGEAVVESGVFGYFSIPALTGDRSNPEVVVKVVDGRPVNGKFWSFFGSLTDVEYTLTIEDLLTGESRSYIKLAGTACGAFDIGAFPRDGSAASLGAAKTGVAGPASALEPSSDLPQTLVLNPAHPFEITLSATDQRTGATRPGVAIPRNGEFGYFSIPGLTGDPTNPEVFIKLLDATAFDGHYWVFYGGLTDLEYTINVREISTGRTRTYFKPGGSACGGFDTSAF
jgi:hypothetical protein